MKLFIPNFYFRGGEGGLYLEGRNYFSRKYTPLVGFQYEDSLLSDDRG